MTKVQAVLFDFDGVLSMGRFYATIPEAKIREGLRDCVFSPKDRSLVYSWMRGEKNYRDVNRIVAPQIGVKANYLNEKLIESVRQMQLNENMLQYAIEQRKKGIKTAVFTDNMDVFEEFLVPHKRLDEKFDYILSSSTYGKLKGDNDSEFLHFAIKQLGAPPKHTLLIDDSPGIGKVMRGLGGQFFLFDDYENGHQKLQETIAK